MKVTGVTPEAVVWVAATAEGESWNRPAAEALVNRGSVRLAVPTGRYRIAAGAPGYVTVRDLPVEAVDGTLRTIAVPMQLLRELSGVVVDADGRAVSNARIGLLRAFVLDDPDALSSKGEAHIAANEMARGDADGIFHMPAHPDARHLLWVEADGFAPAYVPGVTVADPSKLAKMTLARGASLELTVRNEHDVTRLQLFPRNAPLPDGATSGLARAIWTRAPAPRVTWSSLPAGEYEVWARSEGELPRSVLRVTVKEGERAAAEVDVRRPAREAPETAPAPALSLAIVGEPVPLPRNVRVTKWIGDALDDVAASVKPVAGGILVEVPAGCADGAIYVASGSNWFAATPRIARSACEETMRLTAIARADGKVRLTSKKPLPRSGMLIAKSCESRSTSTPAEIPFAIGRDGAASLLFPAGCSAPVLQAGYAAPIDLGVTRGAAGGKLRDFGSYALVEGGLILVRATGEDGLPLAGALIAAIPSFDIQHVRTVGEVSPALAVARAVANDDGWARVAMAPGEYVIAAFVSGKRQYPYLTEPYGVRAGRETIVDPLAVPRPARLTVHVTVPEELSETGLHLESVVAVPLRNGQWPRTALLPAVLEGSVATFNDLPAGRWHVSAVGRLHDDPPLTFGSSEVELIDGADVTIDLALTNRLYRGRVTERGNPVFGTVRLDPVDDLRREVTTALDTTGRFQAVLEGPGLYIVHVNSKVRKSVVPSVRFEEPGNEVEIALASTVVVGRAVRPDGSPAAGAMIEARSVHRSGKQLLDISHAVSVAADGSFRIDSAAPGTWTLQARDKTLSSERVTFELQDEQSISDVLLRLDEGEPVALTVRFDNGLPVLGARVFASLPPVRPGDLGQTVEVPLDSFGSGTLRVPAALRGSALNFEVLAGDGTAAAFRRAATGDVTLHMPATPGALTIELASGEWTPRNGVLQRLVAEDGAILGPGLAGRIVPDKEGRRTRRIIARLAPGTWRYVEAQSLPEIHQILNGNGAVVSPLAVAAVHPGGMSIMTIGRGEPASPPK